MHAPGPSSLARSLLAVTLWLPSALQVGAAADGVDPRQVAPGTQREFWIAAEAADWNIVPTGVDGRTGDPFEAEETSFKALILRAYTRDWAAPLPDDPDAVGDNDGIPGPTLRANVGDTIVVHFKNDDAFYGRPHSLHPHGVRYTPEHDGAFSASEPDKPGTAVSVGESYTYRWTVGSDSVGTWPYHDHSVEAEDNVARGLFGAIVVPAPGEPRVDREFVLFFTGFESETTGLKRDFDAINGRAYMGNAPSLRASMGDRVRFRVLSLGTEFHTVHLHGHRWKTATGFEDAALLGPAATVTFEFVEDAPGTWMFHCHVSEHIENGMMGTYTAAPSIRSDQTGR